MDILRVKARRWGVLALLAGAAGGQSTLALAQATPPIAPTIERLTLAEGNGDKFCTADGALCLSITEQNDPAAPDHRPTFLDIAYRASADGAGAGGAASAEPAAPVVYSMPVPGVDSTGFDNGRLTVWPQIIRLAPPADGAEAGYLIGMLRGYSTMYSGGGGSADRLELFELFVGGGTPHVTKQVLDLPYTANLLIRACFSEADMEDRRGACHDEYGFDAVLALAPRRPRAGAPVRMPDLSYRTIATAYPGFAQRNADSLERGRLRQSDLVRRNDPACSYARTLRFNPASERYEMNEPAPECSGYTVP